MAEAVPKLIKHKLTKQWAFAAAALSIMVAAAGVDVVRAAAPAAALDNGIARTPPMGWNSWNTFGCNVTEADIKATADAMVSSGMRDAGFQYVVVDNCWQALDRDGDGNLQADPTRFPDGIAELAAYVHSKGLKFGIYAAPGSRTCAQWAGKYPGSTGSLGHVEQDAQQFAAWGVDYLKYDWCHADRDGLNRKKAFEEMRDALAATGRPIVYSINPADKYDGFSWSDEANLWRTTTDIKPLWDSSKPPGTGSPQGVMQILEAQAGPNLVTDAGPGGWNDPDMLEVGVKGFTENGNTYPGLTAEESRSHFSLWAMFNAPLMAGNDLSTLDAATAQILTNTEVTAIDQDFTKRAGYRFSDTDNSQTWVKPMSDGSMALALLNTSAVRITMTASASKIGLPKADSYVVRDLWQHTDARSDGAISVKVPPHGVKLYRIRVGTT